ncbi:hypothetical protein RKE29_02750 [Streptomyces sp. B1866]|uniref:hypothetical protein n=1 Tax=Streptomyces sp. B1866 TaxID=3075431 RepID=UPI00288CCC6C|nr:hypothetical protein [Streptomyces sp. B1866]MDT3395578.1 hypothetical protein [Streptomyces sp. B1866]
MTRPPAAVHETAAALRTVRQHWGDLLLAIETPPPADTWPPRQLAHTLNPATDEPPAAEERAPLVLRQHPAPLNLGALDTGLTIERDLFDLADIVAAEAQQHLAPGDPRRWTYRSETDPGSRAHGVHWAALYIEGRVLAEDTEPEPRPDGTLAAPPFVPLPAYLLYEARRTARTCAARLLRELGIGQRTTPIPDRPCPWCGGELTLHTPPDGAPAITCGTGPRCPAPVALDEHGLRVWTWAALPVLVAALERTAPAG